MEQIEIWKTIPNYEDYQVSNLGRVKSLRFGKEKILKHSMAGNYEKLGLNKLKKAKTFKVHKLVAIAFLNHKQRGMFEVVNHINFNKTDNRLCNLEIVSARENTNKKHIKSSSKYTGVSWRKIDKKWVSQIYINGKIITLGYFNNEINASIAYENKLQDISNKKSLNY